MAKRLRIFLSSPSDVEPERLRAHLIIQKLARDYSRFFQIEPYLWEYEPMLASGHFQDMLEPPSEADIVVLVVWSRLGTPLPERTIVREYRGLDGHVPVTGTEWEFETALAARQAKGAPDLLAYRRSEVPRTTMSDAKVRERELQQYSALEAFWHRYFEDRGVFLAASTRYATIDEFDRRLEADLKKLIERRCRQETGGAEAAPGAIWLKGNPFRPLTAYQFEDASIFFGRDGATRASLSRLAGGAARGMAFLLISGASGSGKSSLARAGLLPALTAPLAVQNVGLWRRAIMHPGDSGDDPFLSLARALANGKTDQDEGLSELFGPDMQIADLAQFLRTSADNPSYSFKKALGDVATAARNSGKILPHEQARLVLLVDQLEELFIRPNIATSDRALFIRLLAGLAKSETVWVIATIRSDLQHLATELKEFIALVEAGVQIDLAAPDDAELIEIVRQPAAAAGLKFETDPDTGLGLDSLVVKAAAAEPGVLPLLSVVLDTLYQRDIAARSSEATSARTLTVATYRALGELEGAIAQRAEEIYQRIASEDAAAAAALSEVLRALVTTGDGTAVTARAAPMDDFPAASPTRRLIDAFLAQNARLLVAEDGPNGPEVRLAHEILLSEWPRAQKLIAENRRDIETRARLEGLLHRYNRTEGADRKAALLEGLSLAEGVDLVARWKIASTTPLGAFVATSAAAARWKRQRLLVAALALMVTFAGLAAIATWQWGAAERAQANADKELQQRLANESNRVATIATQLIDEGRGSLATALALQVAPRLQGAADRPLTPQITYALGRSLRMQRELDRRSVDGNRILRLAVTKDERTAVTGLNTGAIQIWDLPSLVLRKNVKAQGDLVLSLDISPDQQRLVVAGDAVPSIWDLKTGEKLFDLQVPNPVKSIKMARYSPNGDVIATAGTDNRILIFNATNGSLVREITGPDFESAYKDAGERAEAQGNRVGAADPDEFAQLSFKTWGATTEIAFSPDGTLLAAAGAGDPEAAVRLYDVTSGTLKVTAIGTEVNVRGGVMQVIGEALQFSANGQRVAQIAPSENIQIFESATGALQRVLTTYQTKTILMTEDGRLLISGHRDGSLAFWCVASGQLVATLRHHRGEVLHLRFNADESLMVSTSSDTTAAVWRISDIEEACSPDHHSFGENWLKSLKPIATFEGDTSDVFHAAFLDGDRKLLTVSRDGTLRYWSMAERGVAALPATGKPYFKRWYSTAFTPDGQTLIVKVPEDKATMWSLKDATLLASLAHDRISSPNGDSVVAVQDTPFTATLVDGRTGSVIPSPQADDQEDFSTPSDEDWDVSADGRRAIGSRGWIGYFERLHDSAKTNSRLPDFGGLDEPRILIDTSSGKELAELKFDHFKSDKFSRAGFSVDGKLVIAEMEEEKEDYPKDNTVGVWDAQTGRLIGQTKVSKDLDRILGLSDDGQLILVARHPDYTEINVNAYGALYRVGQDGLTPLTLTVDRDSTQSISTANVSPDGRFVVAGRTDGSLTVWNTERGDIATELNAGKFAIQRLAMSHDSRLVAAVDEVNTVWVIDRSSGLIIASPTLPDFVRNLRFAPQSDRLIALAVNGTAYVIDPSLVPGLQGDAATMIDWARASSAMAISDADRRLYGVEPPLLLDRPNLAQIKRLLLPAFLPRPQRPDEVAKCDALAADPDDRNRIGNGVAANVLQGDRAVAACLVALTKAPDDLRVIYQYGRALASAGREPDAVTYYKRAADSGYAAAARALAQAIESDKAHSFDPLGTAQSWYERAAINGDSVALLTVAAHSASAADDNATVTKALSMALAAGRNRVSAAAMSVGQRIDILSAGDPAIRRRALFYIELGCWIADNVKQSAPLGDDEKTLRTDVTRRLYDLAKTFSPNDVIATYRAARDWSPDNAN